MSNSKDKDKQQGEERKSVFDMKMLLQWIPVVVSIIPIFISIHSNNIAKESNEIAKKTSFTTNKLAVWANSIDHKNAQNVYKKLEEMLRNLRILDKKISNIKKQKDCNYSDEISFFKNLQISAEYDEIIELIDDKHDVTKFENSIDFFIDINSYTSEDIKAGVDEMIRIINRNELINKAEKKSNGKNILLNESISGNQEGFIQNNSELGKTTELANCQDTILPFVHYLIKTKHIDDPDLLLFYAIKEKDVVYMQQALDAGANTNVTDLELLAKYSNEYEEYCKEKNVHIEDNNGFGLWEFLRNHIIIGIAIIIVVLLAVALIFILQKNKRIQEFKKLKGNIKDEAEGSRIIIENNNSPQLLPVFTDYNVAIWNLNQREEDFNKIIIDNLTKNMMNYEQISGEYLFEQYRKRASRYIKYISFDDSYCQRLKDIESNVLHIIEQRNPSNLNNPEEMGSIYVAEDGSLIEKYDK